MPDQPSSSPEDALNDFLKSVERRAFKRAAYAVRDDDAARDIVQDTMIRLSQSYADRPPGEWPMLFQRILSNAIDMPSIWVLVAVTLGGGIMGVAGMLFLIPLFAVIYRLLAEDTRRRNEMAQGDMPRG